MWSSAPELIAHGKLLICDHIHNLQETLRKKGVDFPNACQILEICNPQRAKEVLTEDMDLNMALPCRVSVYSEGGKGETILLLHGFAASGDSWNRLAGTLTKSHRLIAPDLPGIGDSDIPEDVDWI